MKTCAFIIPVYNEETVIETTIIQVQSAIRNVDGVQFEIICVNDGSSDKTAEVLAGVPGVTVLKHRVNHGYGAALKTGLEFATQEWVFIVDADGTYPLDQLGHFLSVLTDDMSMVVGARNGAGILKNPFKRMARWILRKMVQTLTGVFVPDLNSGMRIFRRDLYLEFRHLLPMGFSFTTTLTVASLYVGHQIKYIPIEYATRVGKSNIKPLKDFLGLFRL